MQLCRDEGRKNEFSHKKLVRQCDYVSSKETECQNIVRLQSAYYRTPIDSVSMLQVSDMFYYLHISREDHSYFR